MHEWAEVVEESEQIFAGALQCVWLPVSIIHDAAAAGPNFT